MNYCVNPNCQQPHNQDDSQFCLSCGASLILGQRYRALKLMGMGGMGKTFLGRDEHLPSKPNCAIKQLYLQHQSPEIAQKAIELFHQEGERLYQLGNHPQIPQFLAYFSQENQLYLVQEFIPGQTLAQELIEKQNLSETEIKQLLTDLLPVLQFIHEQNIIHRDLKPENIIRRQSDQKLILIDFGVARLFSHTALVGGATIVGTPEYMAPETHRGQVLPASDLYSLGVTCLRLLTGKSTLEMYDIVAESWQWRKYLPKGVNISYRLGETIDRLITPSLRQRFQTAAEVLAEIETNLQLPNTQIITNAPTTISKPRIPPTPKAKSRIELNQTELPDLPEIDYTFLKDALIKKKWQEADQETWSIFCQLTPQNLGHYISLDQLKKLPCEHLKLIDLLWLKYSNHQFGFSIQQRIYLEVNKDYLQFCDRVGWQVDRPYKDNTGWNFSSKAPVGHLPSRRCLSGSTTSWLRYPEVLTSKLSLCGI